MTKVYISGPMRGYKDFNFPAFHEAAKKLRDSGYHVFNPAEFDAMFEPEQPKSLSPEESLKWADGQDIRRYARRDLHVILNELDPGDFVVALPGWKDSKGALAEATVAIWIGLRVIEYEALMEMEANRDNRTN